MAAVTPRKASPHAHHTSFQNALKHSRRGGIVTTPHGGSIKRTAWRSPRRHARNRAAAALGANHASASVAASSFQHAKLLPLAHSPLTWLCTATSSWLRCTSHRTCKLGSRSAAAIARGGGGVYAAIVTHSLRRPRNPRIRARSIRYSWLVASRGIPGIGMRPLSNIARPRRGVLSPRAGCASQCA